ncbi:hypothetical protein FGU65_01615 [Methanoculleus sp. FWC-SCC1]|uniref:SMP-30/Gluconolactonase/LRE-like region domain-containing protein n=1 Tax=Methanoculleus frigidifontis TaxID=2584085 RepID=A0ABT8M6Q1_9EURY|nr:SMP-30/gluconolactonase/LRE family protein [Methanoculleus sp. FWC-SCC1]MDN7023607.1 hypothetical protein [Methanoculleus sp. FWC-SCC1]
MRGKYCIALALVLIAVLACQSASASGIVDYELVTTWGSLGTDEGRFNSPHGIAVDGDGQVYVADFENDRIQKFTSDGTFVTAWGTEGSGDGQFRQPRAVAVATDGKVYVAESSRIQIFDSNGTFLGKWGSYGTDEGQMKSVYDLAVDTAGNVYVADAGNDRVQKFNSSGGFLSAWGSLGTYDGEFNDPYGISADADGNVYVVDNGNGRIQKFDSAGMFLDKWVLGEEFYSPMGVTVDTDGKFYVTTVYSPLLKFDRNGTLIARSTADNIYINWAVAIGAEDTVYVTSANNHCVCVFRESQPPTPTITPTPIPTAPAPVSIRSNKGSLVHGNNFVVTISGRSERDYWLYIRDANLTHLEYPLIAPGQPGVTFANVPVTGKANFTETQAIVRTDTVGRRYVQLNTTSATGIQTFTITVVDPVDNTTDDVNVIVERGQVTQNICNSSTYFPGEEIVLSGTNTENTTTYLFLTGPSLPTSGAGLDNVTVAVIDQQGSTFAQTSVETDDSWEYKWDTSKAGGVLDEGTYILYAAAAPRDALHISETQYAVASIQLQAPWIRVDAIGDQVASGTITISGTTNLPSNDELQYTVHPVTGPDNATVLSGGMLVQWGKPNNTWQFRLDLFRLQPDTYNLEVGSVRTGTTTNATFLLKSPAVTPTPTPTPFQGDLALLPGWNFISVPKRLADGNNTAAQVFGDIDTAGHSFFQYDAATRSWSALNGSSAIKPLDGYWIYANASTSVGLVFAGGSMTAPPSKALSQGWNAVGFSSTVPVSARDAFSSVAAAWINAIGWDAGLKEYNLAIVNGGSGLCSDGRLLEPGRGYWLFMTDGGELAALMG